MKNKVEDLYNHLFAAMEGLQDEDRPMEIERARAVAVVAQVAINVAKAETAFLAVSGGKSGSGFIPDSPRPPPPLGVTKSAPDPE